MVLNMLSTGVMIQLGATYGNLMINLQPTNAKLHDRAIRIIMTATSCDRTTAEHLLHQSDGNAKTAIVMVLRKVDADHARRLLAACDGQIRTAIEQPTSC